MEKFKKLFLLLYIMFILTGCIQFKTTIDFSDGKSANLQSVILMKENDLKAYDMTIKSLKKQFISNNDLLSDWEVKETSDTIDNEKYAGFLILSPDSFNEELMNNFSINEEKDTTTYNLKINFTKSGLDLSELKNYENTLSTLKKNNASFELIIQMPGTITKSSLGKINNDTVTIDLYDYLIAGQIPDLTITSKKDNVDILFYLYFVLGIVIIVIILTINALSKKKRKKDI